MSIQPRPTHSIRRLVITLEVMQRICYILNADMTALRYWAEAKSNAALAAFSRWVG
jgi:hypothetical protein